jgi:hypothetical protein
MSSSGRCRMEGPTSFHTGLRAAPFGGSDLPGIVLVGIVPSWLGVKAIQSLTGGGRQDFFPILAPWISYIHILAVCWKDQEGESCKLTLVCAYVCRL